MWSPNIRTPNFRTVFGGQVDPTKQPVTKNATVHEVEAYGFLSQLDGIQATCLAQTGGHLYNIPGIEVVACDVPAWGNEGPRKLKYKFKKTQKKDQPKFDLNYLPDATKLYTLHYFKVDSVLTFNYGSPQVVAVDTSYDMVGSDFDERITVWLRAYPKETMFTTFQVKKDPKYPLRTEVGDFGTPLLKLGNGPEAVLKPYFDRLAYLENGTFEDASPSLNTYNTQSLTISPTGITTLLIGDLEPFESFYIEGESDFTDNTTATFLFSHGFFVTGETEGWRSLSEDSTFRDETDGFKQSGRIYFTAPQDWSTNRLEIGTEVYDELYWLKIEFAFDETETCTLNLVKRHVVCYSGDESVTVSVDFHNLPAFEDKIDDEVVFRRSPGGAWEPATWSESISAYEVFNGVLRSAQMEYTIPDTSADPLALVMDEDYLSLLGQVPRSSYPFEPQALAVKEESLLLGVGPELWRLEEKGMCVFGGMLDPKSAVGISNTCLLTVRRLYAGDAAGSTNLWMGAAWWGPYWPNELRLPTNSRQMIVFKSDGMGVTQQETRDYVFPGDMFYRDGRLNAPDENDVGSFAPGSRYAGEQITIPFSQPVSCTLDEQSVLYIAAGLTVAQIKTDEWYFTASDTQWVSIRGSMKGPWYQTPPGYYMLADNAGGSGDKGARRLPFTFGQEGFCVFDPVGEALYYLSISPSVQRVMKDTVAVQDGTPIWTGNSQTQFSCGDVKNGIVTAGVMDWWDGDTSAASYSYVIRFPTYNSVRKLRDWDKAFSYDKEGDTWTDETAAWNGNTSTFRMDEDDDALYFALTDRQFFSAYLNIPNSDLLSTYASEFWNGNAWTTVGNWLTKYDLGDSYWTSWRIPRTWEKADLNVAVGSTGIDSTPRYWLRNRITSHSSGGATVSGLYCYCESVFASQSFENGKYLTFTPLALWDDYNNTQLFISALNRETLDYGGFVIDYSVDNSAIEFTTPGSHALAHFAEYNNTLYAALQDVRTKSSGSLAKISQSGSSWTVQEVETLPEGEFSINALVGTSDALHGVTSPYQRYAFKYGKKSYPFILKADFSKSTLRKAAQQLAVLLGVSFDVDADRNLVVAKRDYVPDTYKGILSAQTRGFQITSQSFNFDGVEVEWENPMADTEGVEGVGRFGSSDAVLSLKNPLIQDAYTAKRLAFWYFKFFSKVRKRGEYKGIYLFQADNLDRLRIRLYPFLDVEADWQIRGFDLDLKNAFIDAIVEEVVE